MEIIKRKWLGVLILLISFSGFSDDFKVYATKNFTIYAPTAEQAREAAEYSERWRTYVYYTWLGIKPGDWKQAWPITVKLNTQSATPTGGSHFRFNKGKPVEGESEVEGDFKGILNSALGNQIAHVALAAHFNRPLPRWVEEGISLHTESDPEQEETRGYGRKAIEAGRAFPLMEFFKIDDYPTAVFDYLGQSYLVTLFLNSLGRGTPAQFLDFVLDAEKRGWDAAVKTHYDFANVAEMEVAWRKWFKRRLGTEKINPRLTLFRNRNFKVFAANQTEAQLVAEDADGLRRGLLKTWYEVEFYDLAKPFPVLVLPEKNQAENSVDFVDGYIRLNGSVSDFRKNGQIRHEVSHLVAYREIGSNFSRWVMEGLATLSERPENRDQWEKRAINAYRKKEFIPLANLFSMKGDENLPVAFYPQSFLLTYYLCSGPRGSTKKFTHFARDAQAMGWDRALAFHYGYADLTTLESFFLDWINWKYELGPR